MRFNTLHTRSSLSVSKGKFMHDYIAHACGQTNDIKDCLYSTEAHGLETLLMIFIEPSRSCKMTAGVTPANAE